MNYNGDIRQFKPPKFDCFDEIMGFIMNAWPHLNSFKLMYQDDQASWIRITTNIDVFTIYAFYVFRMYTLYIIKFMKMKSL